MSRLLIVVVLCSLIPGAAMARHWVEAVGPYYNPRTKSYFEMRSFRKPEPNWAEARRLAASLVFRGVRGRLAILPDKQVNDWVNEKFTPDEELWIGLRYWCKYRRLQWVNGKRHPRGGYANWYRQWYRNKHINCATGLEDTYMPVYIRPARKGAKWGAKWQASGPKKRFITYLIEYPTGGR